MAEPVAARKQEALACVPVSASMGAQVSRVAYCACAHVGTALVKALQQDYSLVCLVACLLFVCCGVVFLTFTIPFVLASQLLFLSSFLGRRKRAARPVPPGVTLWVAKVTIIY